MDVQRVPKRDPRVKPAGDGGGWVGERCVNMIETRSSRTGPMEYRRGACHAHCSGMLASRITLAHFSVSSTIYFSNSAGDIGVGKLPRSARRALMVGSARAAFISLLSLSTISAGVFLGAPMPCHVLASKPGTDSPTVGTSGSVSERRAVVTANARTL